MKAASSSIYRKIEQLQFWAMVVVDRLPGTTSYKELGATIIRFVDDILVIARRPEDVVAIRKAADRYLREKLNQKLHPKKFYMQEAHKGVLFIGTVVKPGRNYTSRRTAGSFYDAVHRLEAACRTLTSGEVTLRRLAALEHEVCSVNSYLGFTVHTASYNLRKKIFSGVTDFWKVCYIENNSVKIRRRYKLSTYLIKEEHEDYIRKSS